MTLFFRGVGLVKMEFAPVFQQESLLTMSLFTDPKLEALIPHSGTTDPMSIWEEVEKPVQPKAPQSSDRKAPPAMPPKPEKKS